jgi:hypothetical protein
MISIVFEQNSVGVGYVLWMCQAGDIVWFAIFAKLLVSMLHRRVSREKRLTVAMEQL